MNIYKSGLFDDGLIPASSKHKVVQDSSNSTSLWLLLIVFTFVTLKSSLGCFFKSLKFLRKTLVAHILKSMSVTKTKNGDLNSERRGGQSLFHLPMSESYSD